MRRSARFALIGAFITATILASFALVGASGALADGDPASDVLVNQSLFYPIDLGTPTIAAAKLSAMLNASAKAGFPVRVALIDSASDLGTVTALWSKPGDYATYLGTELSALYAGQILVVMPDGFGLYGPGHGAHAISHAEASVQAPSPSSGSGLVSAATVAVSLLAKAAGHPIVVADLHVSAASADAAKTPLAAWLALGLGALLIAACWRASLRARPLSLSRKVHP